ncbi:hypothetical protein PI124_g3127 [Phytophthora idaei]|nr:hypothetical protein PI125_g3522 [Phytophthora idaei]KAG3168074.1 hypothetical protein PI126_g3479 [Phytophthora idaei]KAG3252261.1 hypothetical protein PI124_g3127 [Phytophthora idaei]
MTKTQSQWSSVGLREDDDMDEVERPRLERSSKQVNPRIDNECDDSDEFATTIVHVETEEQSAAVSDADETKPEEVDSNPEFVEQGELSDAEEDERSDEADDLDPLDESSFDNAMISALEGRESYSTHDVSSHTTQRYEVEADDSDSEDYVVQDAIAEDSCEESMDNGDESSDTSDAGVYQTEVDTEVESAAVELPPAAQNSELEESFDGDAAPDSEVSFDRVDEREVDHVGSALAVSDTAVPVEHSSSSIISGELADQAEADSDEEEPGQHGESNVLEESSSSAADVRHTLEGSTSSLERDTLADNALEDSAGEDNASEESLQSVERGAGQQEEENAPEETSSTLRRAVLADSADEERSLDESATRENVKLLHLQQDNALEGSSTSLDGGAFVEDNELEQAAPSIASGDDLNALEESTSSMQNVAQRDEGNALNDSVARVNKAKVEQLDASNSLEESAPSMDDDTAADGLHSYETNAFEESASSVDNTAVAHDEDGGSALEESPSSLASGLREDCSENSLNRASSRHGYADSVALQSDDDDVHVDRGESSFDADMQSDIDGEAGISYEAEVSTQPVKHLEEEAEDECSEEQLRAAEHSLDRPSAPEDDDEAGDNVESAPAPTTTLRMEDDESSEEETMPVQSQPILSTNLSRFGMGTRRLNLEEDDEMDEIERLLLDQSASSKQKRQQQFTRPTTTTENDDKFGESSLQSRGGDDDEFGEDSIRSREDNEIEEISDTSRDNTVDERSIRNKESSTSLEKDTLAGEYEEANTSEELSSTMTSAALEVSAVEEKSLEESATSLKNVETKHVYEDNELEQSTASIASGDMEESTSSVQSILKLELDNLVVRMDQADIEQLNASNSFDESASNLDNDVAGDNLHTYETDALEHSTSSLDNTAVEYQGGDGSVLEESSSSLVGGSREYYSRNSPDRVSSRRTYDDPLTLQSDDDDSHADRGAVGSSRPNPLENSFDADMQSDLDEEASAELSTRPIKHQEEAEDERSEEQLRAAGHSPDRPLVSEDNRNADVRASTMRLCLEDDESSEEETMTVQTQPTFSASQNRFGMGVRRLNLEEDDEMDEIERYLLDQSASSMEKRQQQPRLSSRPAATDNEFGESPLQSRDDDKFAEDSIRSREDNEFEDVSTGLRTNVSEERSVRINESSVSVQRGTLADQDEDNAAEELPWTSKTAALADSGDEESSLDESATSLENIETNSLHEENALALEAPVSLHRGAIADSDNELEQSAASIEDVDTLEESTSSVRSVVQRDRVGDTRVEQLDASTLLEESASSLENDTDLRTYNANALEHSTSSIDNTAVDGEGGALKASSSSLASGLRGDYSENSPDRGSSRLAYDDPLTLQRDDDGIHADRDAAVMSRPNPLESSFNADMQSDLDDEASASYDAELSTQPVMNREEVDDEWLEAERSMRDDHETADTVESAPAPTMTLRMEDDESSEEETMTQPTFSTNLSRFGMGVRRLNLKEDDEMDEVERLLLDQSASSMEKRQQQPRLSSILAATDDDDEFGKSSLQSRGGDEDKFGEDSIRSREDDEFEDVSATSRDNEFDERSVQHDEETRRQQDNRFTGLTRNQANDDDGEFGELSREPHGEDVEFGEDSIRSREDNEFEDELARSRYDTVNERSVPNQGSLASMERDTLVDQDKEGNASEELSSAMRRDALTDSGDEENSLDESATGLKNVKAIPHREEDVLERSSTRLNEGALADGFDEDNELEQSAASIASGHQAEDFTALEESTSSTRSVEQHVEGKTLNDPLEESASNLDNDTAADDLHTNELEHSTSSIDNTAVAFEDGEGSVLEESSSSLASGSRRYYSRNSPDRASSRHTYDDPLALQSDDDDIQADHGVAVISRPNPLENSFDADMQSDLDEEASAELSTRPIKHQEEAEDERSEEQLRAAGHSPDRPLVSEDNRNADVRASTMRLCLEDDESSEEETMTVQTQPTFSASQNRFGMGVRRLNLEEDDEMDEIERYLLDQSASSMEKRQQQPRLSSRPAATDDEFGESPLQSRDDDKFAEDSIRSREDNEFEDVSAAGRPRDNAFGERSISNDEGRRQQANRFTRPLSSNATDEDDGEFGRRSIQSHEGGEAGESPIRFRAHEFGDSSNRSRLHNNEFGIIRSRSQEEDDFGEASIESRGGKSPEVSNNSRLHEEGNFGGSSETNKLSQTLSSLRGESEFGRARISTYPREEVEFGETSARSNSRVEDEFGDTSERSGGSFDEDDIGEISVPLQEDTAILPAPSRFLNVREVEHSTRPTDFSDRGMVYQEGLMNSPMKSSATTTAARDDSASEAEHDYMDDSFDLDESLEEEEDNDERDV